MESPRSGSTICTSPGCATGGIPKAIRRLLRIIESGVPEYEKWLETVLSFKRDSQKISLGENPNEGLAPCWLNGWLPALDSMSLYALIADHAEKIRGGGVRQLDQIRAPGDRRSRPADEDRVDRSAAAGRHRPPVRRGHRKPCEDVPISFFEGVEAGNIVIDNSHRAFQNSDVTVFFMEVLPGLAQGT